MKLRTQYNPKDYDYFIGMDVHKESITFSVYNSQKLPEGKTKRIPAKVDGLVNFIKKRFESKKVLCVYEAGPTGFGLYDSLNARGIDCMITSTLSIQKALGDRVKNDRIDARHLAEQLWSAQLKPIRVPRDAYRELRHLIKARHHYTKMRRKAKQQIKSLLLFEGLRVELSSEKQNFSKNHLDQLRELPIASAIVRSRLDNLIEDLFYVRGHLLKVHRQIRDFLKKEENLAKEVALLRSIPGIGFITATAVLGTLGDPRHLRNPREIGHFLGLAPSESSSGQRVRRGKITHLGNQMCRSLLIEAAWITIRRDNRLAQFYYRIKAKNPKDIGAQKAIVAVARKLTQIIYRLLKDQREYEAR